MVNTPVLFETFARPDYARQVWDAIKASKPRSLYFYSNKARNDKPDEIKRNEEIRAFVKEIDWKCDIHTWFREEYVDVYTSLKGAVDWVCENEEAWITLEEDVVPTPAFFSFCDQMLDLFKNDNHVWCVSGDNFFNLNPGGYDFMFSHYHWMYGWATWRNRWKSIDWDKSYIDQMLEQKIFNGFYKTKEQSEERENELLRVKDFVESTKCWDYYFGLVIDRNNGVSVVPTTHLVTNIGTSGENHKKRNKLVFNNESSCEKLEYQVEKRPPIVFCDYEYDYMNWNSLRKQAPLFRRVGRKVKRMMKKMFCVL